MANQLKFNNGRFRVMLVGDPHESSKCNSIQDKNKIQDYLSLQYAATEQLKPDLVILMGDNSHGDTPEELKKVLLRITKPYAEKNIPFAFVLGNHDLECGVNTVPDQYNVYRQLPCCILPASDEISSFGDYNVLIFSETSDEPVFNFWLMYSGNRAQNDYYSYYDFVKQEQIDWYENKSNLLKNTYSKRIPAVNIQHIPVPEEFTLLKECSALRMMHDAVSGQNEQNGRYYVLDKSKTCGYMGEAPCTSGYNSGQFASWKKTGDVVGAFFGHDHMNDFAGVVDGILLGQCKTAGFRPYGDGLMQGVRIIDINEKTPDSVCTKMVYYRQLIGSNCLSITGSEKILRDRTGVKIDAIKSIAKYTAPFIVPLVSLKILKKLFSE